MNILDLNNSILQKKKLIYNPYKTIYAVFYLNYLQKEDFDGKNCRLYELSSPMY